MKAIGFNEHYGLQTAVLKRLKTKTRRLELLSLLDGLTEEDFWFGIVDGKKQIHLYDDQPGPAIIMPHYNIGEVVAIKPTNDAHFATFPEQLIVPCILAGCPKDGIVLDPFMGTGTTAMVARKYQRQFIGFELNPEYMSIINRKTQVTPLLFV